MTDPVLIVGGGIGGLAAAVALQRAGVPVQVYEQAPELSEVGAGVSLWPNAMRALSLLGLGDVVMGDHAPLKRIVVHRRDGRVLTTLLEPGRYPEPGICVHRSHLQGILAAAVPPDQVQLDRRLVGFETEGDSVTATFHDGSTARGALLIGCDGINSAVRARLYGPAPARYRGYEIWRAVSDFALPDHLLGQATEWWGAGQRFGLLPGEPGRVYWYATRTARVGVGVGVGVGTGADGADGSGQLRELFGEWPDPVRELVESAPADMVRTPAEDRPVPRSWGVGPVTLLGDAAHPMTPNMGQGACAAIEDAVVLAGCLDRDGVTAGALRRYERERAPRTRWIVRQSRRIGRLGQIENPLLVAGRDAVMRIVPERLTAPVQRRVYDYRVAERAGNAHIARD